jgi:hypothetical protein
VVFGRIPNSYFVSRCPKLFDRLLTCMKFKVICHILVMICDVNDEKCRYLCAKCDISYILYLFSMK